MARFFVRQEDIEGDVLTLREDVHHILHVLRYREGDLLTAVGPDGTEYEVRIDKASPSALICSVLSSRSADSEPKIAIILFQGMPKGDKMEWILQKGVELGLSDFVPLRTRRSVVRYEAKKEEAKRLRWQKIAESAAKQSGRGRIPQVHEGLSLTEAARGLSAYDLILLFDENACRVSLKETLNRLEKRPERVAIFIGPEGGWDEDELHVLRENGAVSVGLGPRILRTETAGGVASALILYHFDQM